MDADSVQVSHDEFPVTDTSRKIKQIITNRQKEGKWVCAVPYGYRITNTKEMTYEIDPPAAEIVREIFACTTTAGAIRRSPTTSQIRESPPLVPTRSPERKRWERPPSAPLAQVWSLATIQGILSNDFYIGTLRQKKYRRTSINGNG